MGLVVHHLGHSQSDRVVWLCEELGVPYELKKYDRSPVLAPPEFKALHPMGAAPVIDDSPNVRLAETQACVEWICNRHAHGRLIVSPASPEYANFLYFYHLTNGTLQPAFSRVMALQLSGVVPQDNQTLVRYQQKIQDCMKLLDERLATNEYLAGEEFSVADIMVIFALTTFREFSPVDLSEHVNLLRYIQRMVARPAYKRYLAKGDPDIDIAQYVLGPPPPRHPALAGHK